MFMCRCLVLASTTVLIWDGALMFRREMRAICSIDNLVLRTAFACNRIGTIVMLIPWLRGIFPTSDLDDASCLQGSLAAGILYVVADACGNLSAVARVFLMWNKNPRTLRYLIGGALVALSCNVALMIANNNTAPGQIAWVSTPGIHACAITNWKNLFITGVFIVEFIFDLYAAFLVFVNVMDIPRTDDSQITGLLHKQGLSLLALTLVLRSFNIALSVIPGSLWTLAIIVVEPIIAVVNSRLIVRACEFCEVAEIGFTRPDIEIELALFSDSPQSDYFPTLGFAD